MQPDCLSRVDTRTSSVARWGVQAPLVCVLTLLLVFIRPALPAPANVLATWANDANTSLVYTLDEIDRYYPKVDYGLMTGKLGPAKLESTKKKLEAAGWGPIEVVDIKGGGRSIRVGRFVTVTECLVAKEHIAATGISFRIVHRLFKQPSPSVSQIDDPTTPVLIFPKRVIENPSFYALPEVVVLQPLLARPLADRIAGLNGALQQLTESPVESFVRLRLAEATLEHDGSKKGALVAHKLIYPIIHGQLATCRDVWEDACFLSCLIQHQFLERRISATDRYLEISRNNHFSLRQQYRALAEVCGLSRELAWSGLVPLSDCVFYASEIRKAVPLSYRRCQAVAGLVVIENSVEALIKGPGLRGRADRFNQAISQLLSLCPSTAKRERLFALFLAAKVDALQNRPGTWEDYREQIIGLFSAMDPSDLPYWKGKPDISVFRASLLDVLWKKDIEPADRVARYNAKLKELDDAQDKLPFSLHSQEILVQEFSL